MSSVPETRVCAQSLKAGQSEKITFVIEPGDEGDDF
jgi:hypothetical protein